MDGSGAAGTFVTTASCILFAVHAVRVARDLLTPERRKAAFEACGKLPRLLRSRFRARAAADELDGEVACRMLDWQLGQVHSTIKVLLLATATPSMAIAFSKTARGLSKLQSPAQEVLMVLWYAALLLADSCPWLVTKRTLDFWYSGLMAMLALFITPAFCAGGFFLRAASVTMLLGALLSLARMNLPAVALWCGVHMACECWSHAALDQTRDFLFLWPAMLTIIVGKFEAQVKAELRTDIEAKVMQARHSASDALSAMFYDVVVELDHDRRIVAPTPRLGAFLLRSTTPPLERTPLEDLLVDEEDRVRFRDLLCPADGPASSAFVELAYACMRGGMGTVFQVELFGYRLGLCCRCRLFALARWRPKRRESTGPSGPVEGRTEKGSVDRFGWVAAGPILVEPGTNV